MALTRVQERHMKLAHGALRLIGENIRRYREEVLEMSLNEFSSHIEQLSGVSISRQKLGRIETGSYMGSARDLFIIFEIMGKLEFIEKATDPEDLIAMALLDEALAMPI